MKKDQTQLREILEEHARNPYGLGEIDKASFTGEWRSSKTGNLCRVQIKAERNQLVQMVAHVDGSALAKACASIMCSELEGETIQQAQSIHQELDRWVKQGIDPELWKGDLEVYKSLVKFPERMDCAMLCWRSLQVTILAQGKI